MDAPGLVEVVHRNGLGLNGIERGALVDAVEGRFLGGLVSFCLPGAHVELGLGWPPGGMKEWW